MKNFTFKPMTEDDLFLWDKWINIPHVKNTWFIDGYEPAEYMARKINGNGYDYPFIICSDGEPFGFLQCSDLYAYRTKCQNPKGVFTHEELGTFCFDLFIADENNLGHGYGTKIVKAFVQKLLVDFKAQKILIDPASSNTRAIRCYEKAGFQIVKTAYDGVTECMILEYKGVG